MKFRSEVSKIEATGDEIRVTVTNVRREGSAGWREYSPEISFLVPVGQKATFLPGREVRITVKARP